MRPVVLAAVFLYAGSALAGEVLIQKWQDRPSTISSYVAGMRTYKLLTDQAGTLQPTSLFTRRGAAGSVAIPWTWIAENGDWLRREGQDRFRILSGQPLSNWFTEVDCLASEWPLFNCEDGRNRQMSVPDINTILFDEVFYRRVLATSD